jgi:hypothetical protein
MSIKVELPELPAKAASYGPGFLLSADGSGGPHAMQVKFEFNLEPVVATCSVGRSATTNININPLVTLLWAPLEDAGYSLIADGEAQVQDGVATIRLLGAVLHRHA